MTARTDRRPARLLSEADEAELVGAARRRDEDAVRELIRRLNPRLFRIARGIVDNAAEAEDVLQDAYLKAFTCLADFRGEALFSTWITRITLNCALMRKRAHRSHEEYDTVTDPHTPQSHVLTFPGAGSTQPDTAFGQRQVRGLLEDAVAALPEEFRLVFLMREAEGMSVRAIARDLELNPITVKTRLFRARRRLRSLLEARLHGGFDSVFPFGGQRCADMADRVTSKLRAMGQL